MTDDQWEDRTLRNMRLALRFQLHGVEGLALLRFETSAPNDPFGALQTEEFQIGMNSDQCRVLGSQFLMMADALENKTSH